MNKIAKGLGAERRGNVTPTGGYFGALQVLADVEAQFGSAVGRHVDSAGASSSSPEPTRYMRRMS